ncbi:hypothetical protein [Phenylobacterium sp.]|uniref:hypothetical protein n=1 Tax=Phenylobacterium sp. TaxID=1871053 RepID=UPI003BAD4015
MEVAFAILAVLLVLGVVLLTIRARLVGERRQRLLNGRLGDSLIEDHQLDAR